MRCSRLPDRPACPTARRGPDARRAAGGQRRCPSPSFDRHRVMGDARRSAARHRVHLARLGALVREVRVPRRRGGHRLVRRGLRVRGADAVGAAVGLGLGVAVASAAGAAGRRKSRINSTTTAKARRPTSTHIQFGRRGSVRRPSPSRPVAVAAVPSRSVAGSRGTGRVASSLIAPPEVAPMLVARPFGGQCAFRGTGGRGGDQAVAGSDSASSSSPNSGAWCIREAAQAATSVMSDSSASTTPGCHHA